MSDNDGRPISSITVNEEDRSLGKRQAALRHGINIKIRTSEKVSYRIDICRGI